ncbi:MAG: hypothetical protein LDL56_03055 [Armatimonadetes bacterium]|nr:hypothetical protein [Armatimonadota bacterium]MCA1996188.1 hypothetical protein [Armatimonadota bacterium]
MSHLDRKKFANRFEQDDEVSRAVREAVHRALAEHKRKSNSIAVWKNGKVVILESHEIPVEDPSKPKDPSERP